MLKIIQKLSHKLTTETKKSISVQPLVNDLACPLLRNLFSSTDDVTVLSTVAKFGMVSRGTYGFFSPEIFKTVCAESGPKLGPLKEIKILSHGIFVKNFIDAYLTNQQLCIYIQERSLIISDQISKTFKNYMLTDVSEDYEIIQTTIRDDKVAMLWQESESENQVLILTIYKILPTKLKGHFELKLATKITSEKLAATPFVIDSGFIYYKDELSNADLIFSLGFNSQYRSRTSGPICYQVTQVDKLHCLTAVNNKITKVTSSESQTSRLEMPINAKRVGDRIIANHFHGKIHIWHIKNGEMELEHELNMKKHIKNAYLVDTIHLLLITANHLYIYHLVLKEFQELAGRGLFRSPMHLK